MGKSTHFLLLILPPKIEEGGWMSMQRELRENDRLMDRGGLSWTMAGERGRESGESAGTPESKIPFTQNLGLKLLIIIRLSDITKLNSVVNYSQIYYVACL